MKDFIELSATTPSEENCVQVGETDYMTNADIEARVYINQLLRAYGKNPDGTYFKITRNPHDFGVYLDITLTFDDENQLHVDYMQNIEEGATNWDLIALNELKQAGYKIPLEEKIRYLNNRAA